MVNSSLSPLARLCGWFACDARAQGARRRLRARLDRGHHAPVKAHGRPASGAPPAAQADAINEVDQNFGRIPGRCRCHSAHGAAPRRAHARPLAAAAAAGMNRSSRPIPAAIAIRNMRTESPRSLRLRRGGLHHLGPRVAQAERADFIDLPSGDCGEDPGTLSVP
jgi:hypothetical protein